MDQRIASQPQYEGSVQSSVAEESLLADDQYDEHIHANEAASRVVAVASPYLFWLTISGICAGYLILL
ncbi:MAG: hypothetical protein RIC89_17345 [Pseudomonadales bacterium]